MCEPLQGRIKFSLYPIYLDFDERPFGPASICSRGGRTSDLTRESRYTAMK
jgi:hypothetical protein